MKKSNFITSGILGLSLFHFFHHLYALVLPPLFPLIKDEFGVGNTEVGLIITSISLSMVLFQLPLGLYSDKVGRKKILVFCLSLMICLTFLTSIASAFWMILIFQLILGIGASGYHPVGISAAADLAMEGRVGSTMSIQALGGSLGVALTPILIGGLASLYGWRLPLQIVALTGLGVLLYVVYSLGEAKEANAPTQTEGIEKLAALGIAILYFFRAFVFKGITSFMPTYLVEIKGFSIGWGGFTTGIILLSGALAQLIGGRIADRFNRIKIIIGATFTAAVLLFLITQFKLGGGLIYLGLVLLGGSLYICTPAILSLVESISPSGRYGKAFGINFTTAAVSGMVAPVAIGYIGDVYSLSQAFSLLPLLLIFASIIMLLMRNQI